MRKEIKEMEANLKQMVENERAERSTETAIANHSRTTYESRTEGVSSNDKIGLQKSRNDSFTSNKVIFFPFRFSKHFL